MLGRSATVPLRGVDTPTRQIAGANPSSGRARPRKPLPPVAPMQLTALIGLGTLVVLVRALDVNRAVAVVRVFIVVAR